MSELTIDAADIAAVLRKNVDGFRPTVARETVGRVLEVGDGIARVAGLPNAAVNELLEFEGGALGLALNLEEETIGAVVLGKADEVEEGQLVTAIGRIRRGETSAPRPGRAARAAARPRAAPAPGPSPGAPAPDRPAGPPLTPTGGPP